MRRSTMRRSLSIISISMSRARKRLAALQPVSTCLSRDSWFALSWTIRSTPLALAIANVFLTVDGVKRHDPPGQVEFGQQLLGCRDFVGLLVDLDMRDGQRRLGCGRAEELPCVAIMEGVKASPQNLPINRDNPALALPKRPCSAQLLKRPEQVGDDPEHLKRFGHERGFQLRHAQGIVVVVVVVLGFSASVDRVTPRPGQEGVLLPAVMFIGTAFVAAHALQLWLIEKTLNRSSS
jgi:hypothetical protein